MTDETRRERWYFTFGSGQEHQGMYVVLAGTLEGTRAEMFARFERKWSMQYSEDEGKRLAEKWGWQELTGDAALGRLARHVDTRLQRRFVEFHLANPEVYTLLVHFAREAKAVGFQKYGMKSLFERVRWHMDVETRRAGLRHGDEGYKLNNNLTPYYSRFIMENEKDLDGFFYKRRCIGERSEA